MTLYAVGAASSTRAWVAGIEGTTAGRVWYTDDGGLNWARTCLACGVEAIQDVVHVTGTTAVAAESDPGVPKVTRTPVEPTARAFTPTPP